VSISWRLFVAFWHLDTRNFHVINERLMVLIPKSVEAVAIKDFRPISSIHVLGKLSSKLLANHLALRLDEMVHANQSTFIKGRFISRWCSFMRESGHLSW
jgi:hypothetical protein